MYRCISLVFWSHIDWSRDSIRARARDSESCSENNVTVIAVDFHQTNLNNNNKPPVEREHDRPAKLTTSVKDLRKLFENNQQAPVTNNNKTVKKITKRAIALKVNFLSSLLSFNFQIIYFRWSDRPVFCLRDPGSYIVKKTFMFNTTMTCLISRVPGAEVCEVWGEVCWPDITAGGEQSDCPLSSSGGEAGPECRPCQDHQGLRRPQ